MLVQQLNRRARRPARAQARSGGKITIGSDQANDHGTEDATGKSTFEIEASNDSSGYFFKPTILQGSGGQSITLEIKNDGSVPHNFSITSMNVNVTVEPGASQEVKVTFPQTGTVEYFCSFHHALGMAGELSVADRRGERRSAAAPERGQLVGGQIRVEAVDQLGDLRAHDREDVSAASRREGVWRAARYDEEPSWIDALP